MFNSPFFPEETPEEIEAKKVLEAKRERDYELNRKLQSMIFSTAEKRGKGEITPSEFLKAQIEQNELRIEIHSDNAEYVEAFTQEINEYKKALEKLERFP